jgi:hypothetical protein
MKFNKEYVNWFSRKERAGIAWWRVRIWKLRGFRRGFEKGRCPLCFVLLDSKSILLNCTETRKWRKELLCKKWMGLDQDLAFDKIIGYKNAVELKNVGKHLFRVKAKWENRIKKEVEE